MQKLCCNFIIGLRFVFNKIPTVLHKQGRERSLIWSRDIQEGLKDEEENRKKIRNTYEDKK